MFNLLIKEGGELGEVVGLPGSLVLPNHLECELGYLGGFKDSGKWVTLKFKFYNTIHLRNSNKRRAYSFSLLVFGLCA